MTADDILKRLMARRKRHDRDAETLASKGMFDGAYEASVRSRECNEIWATMLDWTADRRKL
jgi:hypothetical protein